MEFCRLATARARANKGSRWERRRMKPRLTIFTIGVDDLEPSLAFYRDGLGLPTKGIIGREF